MTDEPRKVQEFIMGYLQNYYKMLGEQKYKVYQFKDYFAYSLKGNYTFIKEEFLLKAQIEHYKQQSVNLTFQRPVLHPAWKYIGGSDRACDVRVGLDMELQYKGIPAKTILKNLEHQFVLVKEGREWRIEEDTYEYEFDLAGPYELELRGRRQKKKKREFSQSREIRAIPKGIYNREKAVEYARKYALVPNTKEWKNYEAYGGDCTNFVSQCLFAGGIPFDHQGKYVTHKWYWYSDQYRTPSFTSADALKTYMLNNEGFGLVAQLGDMQSMKLGDIVQLGDLKETTHSMLVVGIVKEDGETPLTKDLLIAQHSGVDGIRGFNIPLATKPNQRVYYNILGYNP